MPQDTGIFLTTSRHNIMLALDKEHCGGELLHKDKDGKRIPEALEHTLQRIRSEQGRMGTKGANGKIMPRGLKTSQTWSFAKGDTSPLWRLYWLSGELEIIQSEVFGS